MDRALQGMRARAVMYGMNECRLNLSRQQNNLSGGGEPELGQTHVKEAASGISRFHGYLHRMDG